MGSMLYCWSVHALKVVWFLNLDLVVLNSLIINFIKLVREMIYKVCEKAHFKFVTFPKRV